MVDGIAIVSGGLDSVTMLYKLVFQDNKRPVVLSFDYGQRHVRELDSASQICNLLGLEHEVIGLNDFGNIISMGVSSLVNKHKPIPEGRYDDESMKSTVVPNRNMVMLSIATGVCIALKGKYIATAVHAGDHAIYPDCRPSFLIALEQTLKLANTGFIDMDFHIEAPFLNKTKTDIAVLAQILDVPIEKTWSCYKGGQYHCGRCGTCVERLEAIHEAGIEDLTPYTDAEFWKTQVGVK